MDHDERVERLYHDVASYLHDGSFVAFDVVYVHSRYVPEEKKRRPLRQRQRQMDYVVMTKRSWVCEHHYGNVSTTVSFSLHFGPVWKCHASPYGNDDLNSSRAQLDPSLWPRGPLGTRGLEGASPKDFCFRFSFCDSH